MARFNENLFLPSELKILNRVIERFENTTTNQIKDLSHQETGWIENIENKSTIPYSYAFELIHI